MKIHVKKMDTHFRFLRTKTITKVTNMADATATTIKYQFTESQVWKQSQHLNANSSRLLY